jgi:hypothetical protein
MIVWMSCPNRKALHENAYTHGPAPWTHFTPDRGDIVVGKNLRGETVVCETWEGKPIPIPPTHLKVGTVERPHCHD